MRQDHTLTVVGRVRFPRCSSVFIFSFFHTLLDEKRGLHHSGPLDVFGVFCFEVIDMLAAKKTKATKPKTARADRTGRQRSSFESAKKKILKTQEVCGICGKPVDKKLKFPHPLSPSIDHIIPVDKGGHPSDISNLQLAHLTCNRQKSDKLVEKIKFDQQPELISNRVLPQTFDWKTV